MPAEGYTNEVSIININNMRQNKDGLVHPNIPMLSDTRHHSFHIVYGSNRCCIPSIV